MAFKMKNSALKAVCAPGSTDPSCPSFGRVGKDFKYTKVGKALGKVVKAVNPFDKESKQTRRKNKRVRAEARDTKAERKALGVSSEMSQKKTIKKLIKSGSYDIAQGAIDQASKQPKRKLKAKHSEYMADVEKAASGTTKGEKRRVSKEVRVKPKKTERQVKRLQRKLDRTMDKEQKSTKTVYNPDLDANITTTKKQKDTKKAAKAREKLASTSYNRKVSGFNLGIGSYAKKPKGKRGYTQN